MHTFFNIPLTIHLNFIDDILYATPKRDKICPCGGRRHLHHKKEQDIRHSYTYEYGTITIRLTMYYERCQTCHVTTRHDGGLDVIQKTTANYRQIVTTVAKTHSLGYAARQFDVSKATIQGWVDVFFKL